jgi:hypothetical protein
LFAAGVGAGGTALARPPVPLDERALEMIFAESAAPEAATNSLSQEVLRTMNRANRLPWGAALVAVTGLVMSAVALTTARSEAAPVPDVKAKATEEMKVLDRVAVENIGGLLACPTVAKELDLSSEQKTKLDEVWGQVSAKLIAQFKGRQVAPQSPEQMLAVLGFIDEAMRANDLEAVKVLTADQLRRLQQVQLQKEGPAALVSRYAVRALTLTPAQEDRLSQVIGRLNKTGFILLNFELGAAEEAAAANPNAVAMKDTVRRVLAAQATDVDAVRDEAVKLLTDDQKKRWKQMTGEPIPTAELLKATSAFSDRRIVRAYEAIEKGNAAAAPPPAKEEKEKK